MSDLVEVKKIGEVERIVHASGLWDGTGPVEFSNDGTTWAETWAPTEDHPLPEFARVEVYRKEVRIPTRATIRWDEQIPQADPFWTAKWVGAPMRHFGRTVRMVGFRQTFRDLLGDIVIEDEDHVERPKADESAQERDWAADITAARTPAELDAIERDGRAARIFTPDAHGTALHRAIKDRRREFARTAWDAPAVAVSVPVPEVAASVPDKEIVTVTDAVERARRAPQDHRAPGDPYTVPFPNRATRRAKSKGHRK